MGNQVYVRTAWAVPHALVVAVSDGTCTCRAGYRWETRSPDLGPGAVRKVTVENAALGAKSNR